MSGEAAISVESVSKKYCKSLRRSMLYGLGDISRNMLGLSSNPHRLRRDEFWALEDVSFEVRRGETLGLIGPNGAGKSTMLKMLNGIFWPDKGRIAVSGRVSALIEVGAGFHPLLSGRENIYVNAAILGMGKREAERKFDSIVEFAGIGDFLDAPVKHYSSGMFVRLGFAVAAHCDPDILLIDEVLAVGDSAFQSKCLRKMAELMEKDTSIILVTHQTDTIRHMCARAALLWDHGLKEIGDSNAVVAEYLRLLQDREQAQIRVPETTATDELQEKKARITRVGFFDGGGAESQDFTTGSPLRVRIDYEVPTELREPVFAVHFYSNRQLATAFISQPSDVRCQELRGSGTMELSVDQMHIPAGTYTVSVVMAEHVEFNHIDWHNQAYFLRVHSSERSLGSLSLPHGWRHEKHMTDAEHQRPALSE